MIVLDEASHVYTDDAGHVVPGVTSALLEITNIRRFVDPDVWDYACELGTAVHAACEYLDCGDLNEGSVAAPVRPYLDAYQRFLAEKRPTIHLIEHAVHHPTHGYAGTLDRALTIDAKRGVLDIKTSSAVDTALVGPQTAAYLTALNHGLYHATPRPSPTAYANERYEHRWALQLRDDGTYRLTECRDPADLAVFLSCLTLRAWRAKHGFTKG